MSKLSSKCLNILIFSDDSMGHINPCIGMGYALQQRGHKIYFLLNESYRGLASKSGFEEINFKSIEATTLPNQTMKSIAQRMINAGFLSTLSPIEKLQFEDLSTFRQSIFDSLVHLNPQIEQAIKQTQPNLIVFDHFLVPPAILQSGFPFVYLNSTNPLGLYDSHRLPPHGAGFEINGDPAEWQEYRNLKKKLYTSTFTDYQNKLNKMFGYVTSEEDVAIYAKLKGKSKYLNIYAYPEELDYDDVAPIPERCVRFDSFCDLHFSNESYYLPKDFANKNNEKLIYFSLGSIGSANIELMKRIISILAKTAHKYVVSKGPFADEYDLPANCWGESYLPQAAILPLVDLVLTHGGNNTTVECLFHGKPMIVFPLFSDQLDNAQRVHEKGFGVRLEAHRFTEQQLIETIDRVLNNQEMSQLCQKVSHRMQSSKSKQVACELMEKLVNEV